MNSTKKILELSLDIETDGPIPALGSISSIGVCTLDGAKRFYVELQPATDKFDPEYAAIHRLKRGYLKAHGNVPFEAMTMLNNWIKALGQFDLVTLLYRSDLNFDGYFIQEYYQRFLGFMRRDLKWFEFNSYVVGKLGLPNRGEVPKFPKCLVLAAEFPDHHALGDALQDAKRFRDLRAGLYDSLSYSD